ncbi:MULTISPECIES: hypothetical protein [unclassified Endozoicomonas]|uniref:hypothetical protein n=2 Tax=unclassified Endozoicomonas TaxID=2644528 RepID=UPI002148F48B|nr:MULTISPECIES: hypothetical protein [unclassified Endozoicomonas]
MRRSYRVKIVSIMAMTLLAVTLPVTTLALPNAKIMGHRWLLSAIKSNRPPSGYLTLDNCKISKNIGDLPVDKRTYRVSFNENFSYDPASGSISTIMNRLYQQTLNLGGTPVLISKPATIILTSRPQRESVTYQIVITHNERTMMQLYECPWSKAVYLWKPERGSLFN